MISWNSKHFLKKISRLIFIDYCGQGTIYAVLNQAHYDLYSLLEMGSHCFCSPFPDITGLYWILPAPFLMVPEMQSTCFLPIYSCAGSLSCWFFQACHSCKLLSATAKPKATRLVFVWKTQLAWVELEANVKWSCSEDEINFLCCSWRVLYKQFCSLVLGAVFFRWEKNTL